MFFCNREGKIREEVRIERGKFEAGERTVIEQRIREKSFLFFGMGSYTI